MRFERIALCGLIGERHVHNITVKECLIVLQCQPNAESSFFNAMQAPSGSRLLFCGSV